MAHQPTSSAHPPLPPTSEEDLLSRLRLLRSRRVGVATYWRLLAQHGTAEAALDVLPDIARAAGVAGYQACSREAAQAELEAGHERGARLLAHGDPLYPALLAALPDAPPLLWMRGRGALLRRPMLALVGARNASSLGRRMAHRLSGALAEAGWVVVSGLARGIDAEAHAAALPSGTIAVLAGGIDVTYPTENADLARRISTDGLALSEQAVGLTPQGRHFPARNRIVAGLARAVIVVEAAARSGSLITARCALEAGREVLAVPGHPFDARAAGCNMLIRDGAALVRGADDVIDLLESAPCPAPPVAPPAAPEPAARAAAPRRDRADSPAPPALSDRILGQLGAAPLAEDQLTRDLGLPAPMVACALTELELEGRVERRAGGLLSRRDLSPAQG
ncbi:DNA-processing protein DprA [Limimaricola pyoseonensis]|uniref:DNA protecting protein DprA n=1 Tax=Limimaricola pyoseonensis TaxID=521013 RepID=A0A1G7DC74_9RHOB|nr:DNA-processing protein DprA [Limimaricola pyoseonensis]SDE49147.1 DNA protecting protein DprA [Limimaricola pyoseonensis]